MDFWVLERAHIGIQRADCTTTSGGMCLQCFVHPPRELGESHEWCSLWKLAVVISCVGIDTRPFRYGFEPSSDVVAPEIPICYHRAREAKLKLCLWDQHSDLDAECSTHPSSP